MQDSSLIYEVTLEPDPEILGDFEAWLEYHVDEMLELPGFTGATIHKAENPDTGAPLRVVRYELLDRPALQRYLEEHAARMRAQGIERFGGRFRASRRIVFEGRDAALTDARPCPNCSELLWGQYCANCGQRARTRMITFWELVKDAGDLVASLDSRLWRTLGLLMFRPGRLTLNYLQGRRASYVPPARLFIATSIVFFFVASLNTQVEFGPGDVVYEAQDGFGEVEAPDADGPDTPATPEATEAPDTESDKGTDIEGEVGGIHFDGDCNVDYSDVPDWLVRLVPEQRAEDICERITADRGRSFSQALLSNVPAMMFLFLPLMALVMKLAYPLSGRYYAEHLLFLVHYHSFFYLLNLSVMLLRRVSERDFFPAFLEMPIGLLIAGAFVYIPIYLFRAMRVVYGQGFWLTAFKYTLLAIAYFLALLTTFLGLLLYTAVTL
ncbi:DUF4286 family protein [Wenzhouxiangella sp. XN24]|uniref:DUF4286 family protein n=1 Tax=Wenzhouxiangella sp. XN24 TaxID=2713569 RepID=UPI0013E9BD01|nr:DUF4286 family protein [Wenzhouxiangella sp. XN24]